MITTLYPTIVAEVPSSNPNWFGLAMGLFGGLALFLYGLDQLSEGLNREKAV